MKHNPEQTQLEQTREDIFEMGKTQQTQKTSKPTQFIQVVFHADFWGHHVGRSTLDQEAEMIFRTLFPWRAWSSWGRGHKLSPQKDQHQRFLIRFGITNQTSWWSSWRVHWQSQSLNCWDLERKDDKFGIWQVGWECFVLSWKENTLKFSITSKSQSEHLKVCSLAETHPEFHIPLSQLLCPLYSLKLLPHPSICCYRKTNCPQKIWRRSRESVHKQWWIEVRTFEWVGV